VGRKKTTPRRRLGTLFDTILESLVVLMKESDRGCVVASGAIIDDLLMELLRNHFLRFCGDEERVDRLFDAKAKEVLGSYSARVKMAFALGLIEPEYRSLFDGLGHIRNDFAHNASAANWNCYATRSRILSIFVVSVSSRQVLGRSAVGVWMGRPV